MNCQSFDNRIQLALGHFKKLGTTAELLAVDDRWTEHGEWTRVQVLVTTMDKGLTIHAEDFRYGGVESHERVPVPLGVRGFDAERLVGSERASHILPPGFPLDKANCALVWPTTHKDTEPRYIFMFEDVMLSVGGFSGQMIRD